MSSDKQVENGGRKTSAKLLTTSLGKKKAEKEDFGFFFGKACLLNSLYSTQFRLRPDPARYKGTTVYEGKRETVLKHWMKIYYLKLYIFI